MLLFYYGIVGFMVGMIGVVLFVMVKSFLVVVCFLGILFLYNVVYVIFGGFMLVIVLLMMKLNLFVLVVYVVVICVLGVIVV